MPIYRKAGFAIALTLLIVSLISLPCCISRIITPDLEYNSAYPTESPDVVETFDPDELNSPTEIIVESIKLTTKVKLRYARTQVNVLLRNTQERELQTEFKLILPENSFFTMFQLKTGRKPITYAAEIVEKEEARRRYHSARNRNNDTVAAGYIELSKSEGEDTVIYNMKYSIPPGETIHSLLMYERQLDRISGMYSDKLQLFPGNPRQINSLTVGVLEFTVSVEEIGSIDWLLCAPGTEGYYGECTSREKMKRRAGVNQYPYRELSLKQSLLPARILQRAPFEFAYQLEAQNETGSAVIISQDHGNYYFVHFFTPQNLPRVQKHVVFLLDVSDSMHGMKLDQVKWSMTKILDDLDPDDFFSIIAFSNDITIWTNFQDDWEECPYPFAATTEHKASAKNFINEKLLAHGTTNIFQGLTSAFDLIEQFGSDAPTCEQSHPVRERETEKLPPNVESMIFFLSDGNATSGPTHTGDLLKHFYKLNHDNRKSNGQLRKAGGTPRPVVPIHTIAYGEDANVSFLRRLSRFSGGITKVIEAESGAGVELANFYKEISSQILLEVQTSLENTLNGTAVSSSQISHPVVVYSGGEVITTGDLFPKDNQSFTSANYRWSTTAVGRSGKLAYYNSPVYDCTTLEATVRKCVERIDVYLKRLQAYQLLQKWLERDKMVQEGYICPRAYHQQFDDLKMEKLKEFEEGTTGEALKGSEDPGECYNIYKQRATELALKNGFVTPYTSFILTTESVDDGLKVGSDPPAPEGSGETPVENGQTPPQLTKPEKIVFLGSGALLLRQLPRLPTFKFAQQEMRLEPREVLPPPRGLTQRQLIGEKVYGSFVGIWNNTSSDNGTSSNNSSEPSFFERLLGNQVRKLKTLTFLPGLSTILKG